jgi:hypothetical protein
VAVGFLIAVGVTATLTDHFVEPDIFWHLRDAQYVVSHQHIVTQDLYSFTVSGAPWVSHEWVSELVYYGAYKVAGWQGIFGLYGGLMVLLVLGVYWLALREGAGPVAAGLCAALAKVLIGVGSGPRMQHLGWLCFIAVYAILQKYRAERRAPLWALPFLFCLWINLHGSWLSGAAIWAVLLVSGFLKHDLGRIQASPWSWPDVSRMVVFGALSFAALFVNPTGYKAVLYPFETMFRMPLQQHNVLEWQGVYMAGPIGLRVLVTLAVLLLVAVASKKPWRADEVLLTLFVLYFGLTHQRLLVLTGFVLPPILASRMYVPTSYDPSHERRRVNVAVCCAAVVALVILFPRAATLQGAINKAFPAAAVEYLKSHRPGERMYHTYHWGGFLEWNLPETRTFVDGRGDIFEFRGVLKDYLDIYNLRQSKELLDRYKIDCALIEKDAALAYLLNNTSGWRRVYADDMAVIFQREK